VCTVLFEKLKYTVLTAQKRHRCSPRVCNVCDRHFSLLLFSEFSCGLDTDTYHVMKIRSFLLQSSTAPCFLQEMLQLCHQQGTGWMGRHLLVSDMLCVSLGRCASCKVVIAGWVHKHITFSGCGHFKSNLLAIAASCRKCRSCATSKGPRRRASASRELHCRGSCMRPDSCVRGAVRRRI
jgi:hypothetical protein